MEDVKQKNFRLDAVDQMNIDRIMEAHGFIFGVDAVRHALGAEVRRLDLTTEDVARVARALVRADMPDAFVEKIMRALS